MTDLMQSMTYLIATEGDYGFQMAADEFENSNDHQNVAFGNLLRKYVDIQTYVRLGQPIPLEMAESFKKLNDKFEASDRKRIDGHFGSAYEQPLGPFYLKLQASQTALASNLRWLEEQPVRELDLNDMQPGNDLKMIFRNHRFQSLKRVTVRPHYNLRDVAGLAAAMKEMTAHSMLSITFLWGVNDRLGLIKSAFQANKTIPKGAELFMQKNRVHVKK